MHVRIDHFPFCHFSKSIRRNRQVDTFIFIKLNVYINKCIETLNKFITCLIWCIVHILESDSF